MISDDDYSKYYTPPHGYTGDCCPYNMGRSVILTVIIIRNYDRCILVTVVHTTWGGV
jgi:hypothetical protein